MNCSIGQVEYRSHEEVINYQNYYLLYYLDKSKCKDELKPRTSSNYLTKTNSNSKLILRLGFKYGLGFKNSNQEKISRTLDFIS